MRDPVAGTIKPGTIINDLCSHEDFMPTLAAAAGEPALVDKLKKGQKLGGDRTFKVHLDGNDLGPFLRGEQKTSPREGFLYWSDDGDLMALRVHEWKILFKRQDHTGLNVWKLDFTTLRAPDLLNIRSDPFERGPESMEYGKWMMERSFMLVPAQAIVGKWLQSFKEFPPRAKPASFSLDHIMDKISTASPSQN